MTSILYRRIVQINDFINGMIVIAILEIKSNGTYLGPKTCNGNILQNLSKACCDMIENTFTETLNKDFVALTKNDFLSG